MPGLTNRFNHVVVNKKLKMGKGAQIVATNAAGTETVVDMTELAVLGGVTATAAELNTMTGILATTDELNRVADVSTRIVSTTAATISVTLASHDSKVVVLASTHTQTLTLPAATGSGARFRFLVSTTGTDGSKIVKVANTLDVMTGVCASHSTATNEASSFLTSASSDTITLNNTTTGGLLGSQIEVIDIATNLFQVKVDAAASGTVATPFSAGV